MAFYTYRISATYPAGQPPVGGVGGTYPAATRFIPQYSPDAGTSWRAIYPGDQPQALLEAQQRLAEATSAENTLREKIIAGQLGTFTDFIAYP